MAEWTGPKRTLNSIDAGDAPPRYAASDHLAPPPPAPGATSSPQIPGMTPDEPDLPGQARGTLLPLASTRRPLTEYETAQRLLRLFTPAPGTELKPSDWEQGAASFEELRKAAPAFDTPPRPLNGYGLGIGRSAELLAPPALKATDATAPALAAPSATAERPAPAAPDTRSPAPGGAVPGDGAATCPPGFPVKGNAQSMIYHTLASRVYDQTVPEFCFSTPEAAQAAGYRAPKNA